MHTKLLLFLRKRTRRKQKTNTVKMDPVDFRTFDHTWEFFSRELIFFHSIRHEINNKMFFCLSLNCSLSARAMFGAMLYIFTKTESFNMVIGLKMQICLIRNIDVMLNRLNILYR